MQAQAEELSLSGFYPFALHNGATLSPLLLHRVDGTRSVLHGIGSRAFAVTEAACSLGTDADAASADFMPRSVLPKDLPSAIRRALA